MKQTNEQLVSDATSNAERLIARLADYERDLISKDPNSCGAEILQAARSAAERAKNELELISISANEEQG